MKKLLLLLYIGLPAILSTGQSQNLPKDTTGITCWITTADQSVLLKQLPVIPFGQGHLQPHVIMVDSSVRYQTIDGFGFALTGGSASLINSLDSMKKETLLKELFGSEVNSIGISYLRISIGASDLSARDFTYDEMPAGQTDQELEQFSIGMEKTDLIPILKKILFLQPGLKILGSPWTAPTWMKSGRSYTGGSLLHACYGCYARYFVKYIQAMAREGIPIDAITPQNEPLFGGNNPSMLMNASEEADFIKNYLGPEFRKARINTRIIVYDHNADRPDYPLSILADSAAAKFVDGSAFHLYGGEITALGKVHMAQPGKNVYFTEQWVGGPENFAVDLRWHVKTLIIGASRNWSRNVLEWNLASDPAYNPHTVGGCNTCLGGITIGREITRNVGYFIIGHASKFVSPGSVRIASNEAPPLENVAFLTPEGKKVLIVLNDSSAKENFSIVSGDRSAVVSLDAGAVATCVW